MRDILYGFLVLMFIILPLIGQEELTGKQAPEFALKTVDGKMYRLSENLDKGPLVINFWATWCVPCIEELKQMKKIYDTYADKGVEFLAISIDDTKTMGRVNSFVKSRNYPFTILLDTNSEVMHLYQSAVPPYTVIMDKTGKIVYSHVGYRMGDEKQVEKVLKELLEHSEI